MLASVQGCLSCKLLHSGELTKCIVPPLCKPRCVQKPPRWQPLDALFGSHTFVCKLSLIPASCQPTMLRSLNFSRLLAAQRRMPSSCGGAARSAAAGRGLATEHTTGPGLPVAGVMSEEQEKKTSDRLYEGGWGRGSGGERRRRSCDSSVCVRAGHRAIGSIMRPCCIAACNTIRSCCWPCVRTSCQLLPAVCHPAGDKVEDAPRAKVLKPEQEQPAAQDIDQGGEADARRGACLGCAAGSVMSSAEGCQHGAAGREGPRPAPSLAGSHPAHSADTGYAGPALPLHAGTGAERVRTPTSPGREETDAAEPKGGPM